MTVRPDPVTTQVVRYALERVADEMGLIITRTARSTQIKEIKDVSCAVFDARDQTVAQAHHAPMLLTGFPLAMHYLLERYRPEEVAPGDVIACNDPYLGGQHVMDLILFSPVFLEGELVGWVGSMAHHTDLGRAAPGRGRGPRAGRSPSPPPAAGGSAPLRGSGSGGRGVHHGRGGLS